MIGGDYNLIVCRNVKRTYPPPSPGEPPLELVFPDLEIPAGRRIALLGISGSGKSTLLNLVAGLDYPDAERNRPPSIRYRFSDGLEADMVDRAKPFPRDRMGFVFQEGHLITDAPAALNAGLPGLLNGLSGRDDELRNYMDALALPPDVGGREAWRLSGGQKQRVALLRALFHSPQIVFADEPTSSLDRRTAEMIMRLLVQYQQQDANRTLFWATHDLGLAREFATDFLVVRNSERGGIELEAFGQEDADRIESKVYAAASPTDPARPLTPNSGLGKKRKGEVPYTEAKLGIALTFARRSSPYTLSEIGSLGRWMGSIEAKAPPLLQGLLAVGRLYRRFSDFAVAAAVGCSILMLAFVFLGLWTMGVVRDQAMSDPMACNVVAAARDVPGANSAGMELTPALLTTINETDARFWRSEPGRWQRFSDWLYGWLVMLGASPRVRNVNLCGEASDLVFGRNVTTLTLGLQQGGQCVPIRFSPKTLVASFAEPAMTRVAIRGGGGVRRLGDVVPQAMRDLRHLPGAQQLSGQELFVTEGFREAISSEPMVKKGSRLVSDSELAALQLCLPAMDGRPLPIGGVVSGLPQPRGLPYEALIDPGTLISTGSDTYDQAIFYTHPQRARLLADYLTKHEFAFAPDDIERMAAANDRFAAINWLILIVGGIMLLATFFFLFTCVVAFMEKNARPNAVLRAYGLTKSNLRRQIYWRLGATAVYSVSILLFVGSGLGFALYSAFKQLVLPLPGMFDVLEIGASALAATVVGIFIVVRLSVGLWWRRHGNIAQELN